MWAIDIVLCGFVTIYFGLWPSYWMSFLLKNHVLWLLNLNPNYHLHILVFWLVSQLYLYIDYPVDLLVLLYFNVNRCVIILDYVSVMCNLLCLVQYSCECSIRIIFGHYGCFAYVFHCEYFCSIFVTLLVWTCLIIKS